MLNQPRCPIPHLPPQVSNYSSIAMFLCAALAASSQQTDTIKVQTILVNEPVTVRNSKGQLVDNLQQGNFHLTDNGVEQQITHFELGGDAFSLVILVETSLRIESLIPDIRKNGILLAQTVMGPNAEAAVIGFNDSVDKLQDFTTNQDAVEKAFQCLDNGYYGSKLYDAMALGVEMLRDRPGPTAAEPRRRRVMLVIGESDDKGSEAKLGAVLREAQLQNVTIWSVGLSTVHAKLQNRARMKPTDPDWGDNNLIPLAAWAVYNIKDQIHGRGLPIASAATGGSHIATWNDRSIQTAIDQIAGEIHSQYLLTYTPAGDNAPGYHEIQVRLDNPTFKIHFRAGYYR